METQKIKYKGINYTIEFKDLRSIHKNSILCDVVRNGKVINNRKYLIIDKTLTGVQKYNEIHKMLNDSSKYKLRTLTDITRVKQDLDNLGIKENLSNDINKIIELGGIYKVIEQLNTNGKERLYTYLLDLLSSPKYRISE